MKVSTALSALGAAMIGAALVTAAVADERHGRGPGPVMEFAELDWNGDGTLNSEDIEGRRAERFASIDANGDGSVTLEEFQAHMAAEASERAATMFERLDADGDGVLSRDVLEMRGGGRGPDMLARAIERFDTDGDGGLSEAEFDALKDRMAEMRGNEDGRGFFGRMGHGSGRHN